jgi:hypothetical protein
MKHDSTKQSQEAKYSPYYQGRSQSYKKENKTMTNVEKYKMKQNARPLKELLGKEFGIVEINFGETLYKNELQPSATLLTADHGAFHTMSTSAYRSLEQLADFPKEELHAITFTLSEQETRNGNTIYNIDILD